MACKYIFVTGGVVSGLGKGTSGAALGRLLKARGLAVVMQKQDPYLNVDPGNMSPFQHGEVFVTDDGAETDLDLGHYERFTDENTGANSTYTSGKIYWSVLERERTGDFLGGTVQVIPHITNEIKNCIYRMGRPGVDVVIVEIGGTVGDMESRPHLEAIRQIAAEVGRANVCFVHVSLVVQIPGTGELKSKPTQHSVSTLLSMGIQPDVIVARADAPVTRDLREKISLFCNIPIENVIENQNVKSLYELPVMLHKEGLDIAVCKRLDLGDNPPDMTEWESMLRRYRGAHDIVKIALVGKYVNLHDAYLSVSEALYHGAIENDIRVEIDWVDSESLTAANAAERLLGAHGILVPGGFGDRGIEGMVVAAEYARTQNIPYFGICLGLQIAVIEAARNVLGLADANSTEFAPDTTNAVIAIVSDSTGEKTGAMRLGSYPCELTDGTIARELYGTASIAERHRHRYELNNDYMAALCDIGFVISGKSPDGRLVEMLENRRHPWFLGVQFHPEFKSRPTRAHPLFRGFVGAAKQHRLGL